MVLDTLNSQMKGYLRMIENSHYKEGKDESVQHVRTLLSNF